MGKPLYHIITERLWTNKTAIEKKKLFELLLVFLIFQLLTVANLVIGLLAGTGSSCIICDSALVLIVFVAVSYLIYGREKSALNTFFTLPVFIYAYFVSDFSAAHSSSSAIYQSATWLLAGAFFLLYYTETDTKAILYSLVSLLTIFFLLHKTDAVFDFNSSPQFLPHPLISYIVIFSAGLLLRKKYFRSSSKLTERLNLTRQSISKVFRESTFPVVEIKAERDDEGNIIQLLIKKINNSFESAFKIQLHEAKDQEANYILDLALRQSFDLNNLILFGHQKTKEFHASKLDRWYKTHILKPDFNNFFIIFEDITKEKKTLSKLDESRKRYKVLLEAIPDMFFVIGKDGTYEDFVIKESDLYKLEDANIVGNTIFDVGFPQNMADKIMSCIQSSIKNNTLETIEYSLATPNGTFLYEMRLAKLSPRSVISVARDITKRKNAEFNLERAKKKAEESDRLKSAFLANLSHEIRTPLNIITNFTRILSDGVIEGTERTELSEAITNNATQLLNMIDNTIHLSKIETDTVDVSMKFCSVNSLLRDVYIRYKSLIPDSRQVDMRLGLDVPNNAFGFITDRKLLLETFQILLDNAVKYTHKGEIFIGYEMVGNSAVKFTISDTGIGIPPDEKENVFIRFYRIKNEINDLTTGSGIGLSIAQHFIQLLGGELKFTSTPDQGSAFWFSLPFKEGEGFLRIVS